MMMFCSSFRPSVFTSRKKAIGVCIILYYILVLMHAIIIPGTRHEPDKAIISCLMSAKYQDLSFTGKVI